ncbi:hypothetical protein HNV12_19710 [Methanococcoides sp. SA1]|nr:hypothetical protein [Methanococcoides sp. SA1]
MSLAIKKISLTAIVVLGFLALSSPSLAEFVDMIGDELGDLIESETKPISASENEKATSTKDVKHSGSSSASNSKQVSQSTGTQILPEGDENAVNPKPVEKNLYDDLKRYTSYYNNGIDEVPDLIKKVAGNDVIVLEIATNENTDLKIKAVTKDGVITEFREVSSVSGIDPTVSVSANEDAIRKLLSSDDPMGQLSSSLNNDDIEIECKGFLKKAAVSALKNVG